MVTHEKNIYVNGDYLTKNPTWGIEDSEWKATEIDKLMRRNGIKPRTIAEVGCGFGQILLHLERMNGFLQTLHGFDISPQAIEFAKRRETDKIHFYLSDFAAAPTPDKYDLILVIDVIEHLTDYMTFLSRIRDKADKFIFHIPLDMSCRTLLKPHIILQQRNDVGHLHYFTKDHVEWMLNETGFTIVDWLYTFPEVDRQRATNVKNFFKKLLRKVSYSLHKNLSVKLWGGYSIMILATRNE